MKKGENLLVPDTRELPSEKICRPVHGYSGERKPTIFHSYSLSSFTLAARFEDDTRVRGAENAWERRDEPEDPPSRRQNVGRGQIAVASPFPSRSEGQCLAPSIDRLRSVSNCREARRLPTLQAGNRTSVLPRWKRILQIFIPTTFREANADARPGEGKAGSYRYHRSRSSKGASQDPQKAIWTRCSPSPTFLYFSGQKMTKKPL